MDSIDQSIAKLSQDLLIEAERIMDSDQSSLEKLQHLVLIKNALSEVKDDDNVVHQVHGAVLDTSKVPVLVGEEQRLRAAECIRILTRTRIPLYLIGDSGTGKSATMKAILKAYAEKYKVPAYYFQLSREDTKTSVIMGHRIIHGSLRVVLGILAVAASQPDGAIVAIDEITHSTHSMLTSFNFADGDGSVLSIGDVSLNASKVKIIYGSNSSRYAGNITLPQSFVNRVVSKKFEHPNAEDECAIALAVAKKNYIRAIGSEEIVVPNAVVRFLTSFIREIREKYHWPLSARNIANGILLCQLAPEIRKVDLSKNKVDPHFTKLSNAEPLRVMITRRIMGHEIKDVSIMQDPHILAFIEFVSKIGVSKFKEIILQAINFDASIDGVDELDESSRKCILADIL